MAAARTVSSPRALPVALLAAVVLAAFWSLANAQQRAIDRHLVDAGFVMRIADTPGKMARLKALPAHRFSTRTKDGVRYYIYADPDDCKCAFVGYRKAYDAYSDMVRAPTPPPGMREFSSDATRPGGAVTEHLMLHEMNEDAGLLTSGEGDDMFHLKF